MAKPPVAAAPAEELTSFLDFIREGEDDLDAGRWISHEELVRELKDRHAKMQGA